MWVVVGCVLLLLVTTLCQHSVQGTLALTHLGATRDATICSDDATGSIGVGHIIAGATAGGPLRRGLVYFNLTSSLPGVPKHFKNVTLTLTEARQGGAASQATFSLRRLQRGWTTGTSFSETGRCAPATPKDATWKYSSYDTATWNHPGGDIAHMSSANATLADNKQLIFDVTADVKEWVNGQTPNHGWALLGNESTHSSATLFYGSESSFKGPFLTFNH